MKNRLLLPHVYHVHHKLGLLFFALFLILILVLGLVLYPLILKFYFQQVVNELIHRGHSYASVLSQDFTPETLHHVEMMEKYSVSSVAVVDAAGAVIAQSQPVTDAKRPYLQPIQNGKKGSYELVAADWINNPYLVAKSPAVLDDKTVATVVMFTPTEPIRSAVQSMQQVLFGITLAALLASALLIFVIAKGITRPLVNMKNAVQRLTHNSYQLSLTIKGKDEIAELNRSLLELADELKHYRTERQEFLAEVSHELRTPITYIKGYADVLSKGVIDDENERSKYIGFIQDATNRLYQLTNELFELIQLDQVNYRVHKQKTDLIQLVKQVVNEMQNGFADSKVALTATYPDKKESIIFADAMRIRQVIFNLLDNARKYTLAGGRVEVEMADLPHEVEITVRDTGNGIPPEALKQIWQRFYRVEKSRSREYGGAGLGLSISKRIVELHNGTIEVDSQLGKGSVFTVRLPKD
ncbi:HAMP domain-containing sensor histidine kinase [Effusibacillus dendaii]|uniref:histidine kinase n=1 Tax=Effusibacillus dendaii TaxID=2743772 RepID=A0A7I8DH66_9BACL|nr:HAMP domain-containing sensor histidine kinase [Effusibacillus dendaii]BCJ88349.1 two-component sensor histidine kinase [Effusibacillus dendaii]